MNKPVIDALATHLKTGITLSDNQVPTQLLDTAFVREKHPDPSHCVLDGCSALIKSRLPTQSEDEHQYVCHEGHTQSIPLSELVKYKFQPKPTLKTLSEYLDLTPSDSFDIRLPKYATVETEERIDVCLIGNPRDYEEAIEERIKRAIRNHRVTVLLVPRDSIEPVIRVAESHPVGSLVCPFPLPLLKDRAVVQEMVSKARLARNRTEEILEKRGLEFNNTIDNLAENPPLIVSALTYLRILREESGTSPSLGEEFEKVCKAAFASLGLATKLEFGGTANRGEKIPDIVVGFGADPTRSNDYSKALGIVDAKSGSTGNFSSEKIAGKHTDYLKRARQKEAYRGWHISQIFVVFDIDGYKEIDWFDEMRDAYSGYDDDVTTVVLYADALRELVAATQNIVQRSELKQSSHDFGRLLRPLFDHSQHDADWVDSNIASMVRVNSENPSEREQEYIRDYYQRSQLLVVTAEMVHTHLRTVAEEDEWRQLLDLYSG